MGNEEIRSAVGKGTSNSATVGTSSKKATEIGSWCVMPAYEAQSKGYCWARYDTKEQAVSRQGSNRDIICFYNSLDTPIVPEGCPYWALAWVPECRNPATEAPRPATKKPDVSLIPYFGWLGVIRALEAGNSPVKGYERDDWKPGQKNERSAREHANAVIRHAMRYLDGEILDPETGLPHLDHAATRAMMGREVDTATMRKDFGNG